MRAAVLLVLLVAATLVLPACQMNERMSGTLMGAVGGGVVGGAVGGAGGAVVGVLAGGVAGYLVGDYLADRRERGRGAVFEDSAPAFEGATYRERGVRGIKRYAAPAPGPVDAAARAAYEQGRRAATATEARVHFEESIRLDPTRPAPWNALALNHLYRGDHARAVELFEEALARDPDYYPARYNLRRFRAQAGR